MDTKEYWQTYEYVEEVYRRQAVYDETIIHAKVRDIINKRNATHDVDASSSPRQPE